MINLPLLQQRPPAADCGPCTLCCDAIGVPDLGKPFYARCPHLKGGCGIYETRPQKCRAYRCVWHLGILGEKVERRPDHTGVLFELEHINGRNHLGVFEVIPGAFKNDRMHYLIDIILKSKKVANLPMGDPPVRFFPYGSDIPVDYPISPAYSPYKSPPLPMMIRREVPGWFFGGKLREFLMPHSDNPDASKAGTEQPGPEKP